MKLLTLNTHSLMEANQTKKNRYFLRAILKEQPDIIALQEVNQSCNAPILEKISAGWTKSGTDVPLRKDNHAAFVADALAEGGLHYHWTWTGIKLGYDKFDEGIALLSKAPILEVRVVPLSSTQDYTNWRTRAALGIRTEQGWFYSVHMGWWKDAVEPFVPQWERLMAAIGEDAPVHLMGDFNSPPTVSDESYAMVMASGWQDTYEAAIEKDDGCTVAGKIDGWKDGSGEKMRIDYIFSRPAETVRSSYVIFNDVNEPVVSDHAGILVEND